MKLRTLLIVAALLTLTVSMAVTTRPRPVRRPGRCSWAIRAIAAGPPYDTSGNPGQAVTWVPYWAPGNASIVISDRGRYFASIGTVLYRLSDDHTAMNRYVGNGTLDGHARGGLERFRLCRQPGHVHLWPGRERHQMVGVQHQRPGLVLPHHREYHTLFVTSAGLMSFTLDGI